MKWLWLLTHQKEGRVRVTMVIVVCWILCVNFYRDKMYNISMTFMLYNEFT